MISVEKGWDLFNSLYGLDKNVGTDEVLRISLMYIFTCCGILFLIANAIIAFSINSRLFGFLDLAAAFTFSILVIWPKKKSMTPFINIGVFVIFAFYLFIFASGGSDERGFVWSYTFPLFTFFLFGCRKGLIISSVFFLSCLLIITHDVYLASSRLYDLRFGFRYIFSFLSVILFSYIYEFFRERSERAFRSVELNLESMVDNRTKSLAEEIEKKERLNSKLTKAKKEWERTFDTVPANISIVDADFNIVRANKSMVERVGLPFNQVIGKKCYNVVDSLHLPPNICPQRSMLRNRHEYSTEIYCEISGKHFFLTVSPFNDEDGGFAGAVHVAYDISDQKAAERERTVALEKVRKSEKMEAIGLVAGGVAHDLNNILSGVVTYPDLLLQTTSLDNPLYKPLESIKDSGKRASAVVSDLLTIARGVSSTKNVCSLIEILKEYFESIEFKNLVRLYPTVTIDLDLTDEPIHILCNVTHIQKMIMNLVTNAMEEVDKNGNVGVIVRGKVDSDICEDKMFGEIIVKDDGHGIDVKDLTLIFEPFYSKKSVGRSGTGLGLSIVKNIIDEHGATVKVASDSSGTSFIIQVPACAPCVDQNTDKIDISLLKGVGTVLIVDDEERQLKLSGEMVEFLGYEVKKQSSGEGAINYFQSDCADVVLLDMNMDPGIDGIETYQRLIECRPNQKTILISGYVTHEVVDKANELGISAILEKPLTIQKLAETIQNTLAEVPKYN